MANQSVNNVKLGAFVLGGILFLSLLLFMIGKNKNFFGSTYVLRARFANVSGLIMGNDVRFAGIHAGTVKAINILNDTVIEVSMIIDKKMLPIIHNNAVVSIATDGLVGNKVMNITPSQQPAALTREGDILLSKNALNTDDMLQTLYNTNNDVAIIAANLKTTIQNINNSSSLNGLLNDGAIPRNLDAAMMNVRAVTSQAKAVIDTLYAIVKNVKDGKGSIGMLLADTVFASKLNETVLKVKSVGNGADRLVNELNTIATGIQQDIDHGKGTANALLKDSMTVKKIDESLDNIQKGTDGFNQNMEALKHNFLLRGYFKRQEKQKQKDAAKARK